jgi:hypothetical protein
MTQDCDPDIHHANEHSQVSVPEVVSTRAEGRSPSSSSSCSETSPDARSVQLQEEQHTFLPSWNDSDFTMPLEQYTFDPSWIDSDFIMPQEQHTFNPSWINVDFAIPVGNFTDANIQARSEADHDDNRLSRPRFESNDFQYTIRDNPSPTDLSWTPYGDQATTQDLEKKPAAFDYRLKPNRSDAHYSISRLWEHQESQCHTGVGRGQSRRGYVAGSTAQKVEDRRPEEDCANGEDNTGPYCTRRRRLLLTDTRKS